MGWDITQLKGFIFAEMVKAGQLFSSSLFKRHESRTPMTLSSLHAPPLSTMAQFRMNPEGTQTFDPQEELCPMHTTQTLTIENNAFLSAFTALKEQILHEKYGFTF